MDIKKFKLKVKNKYLKLKENDLIPKILISLRLFILFSFLFSAGVMFHLKAPILGSILLFTIAIYLILNKLDKW